MKQVGRPQNKWRSRKMDIPDPVRKEVEKIVTEWKLKQKTK